ncbi:bifunctional metallophosphatase/5'-nucleotidase [Cohnella luojiensis]|uniref:Bifunctional metallophosphatase/5'-nucleotidase n=1 Tax=Cohnella luojiensis TaxID=652876 RepID=A0A4Y8M584_9BACL|nr:5'-nucleotidase C-terminal domain-containing protein [Cohnella luojiensis]TFE30632.1 bifunctional metallophosphatase/5'-nucleotidase [Cohnella luojiensis]
MTKPNVTLTLLHTNDLHSHFEETSRIAGYVGRVKDRVDHDKFLVLDCGDFLDRARLETEGSQGAVNRAVLEHIGFDAVMFGNNEGLSYTLEQLDVLFRDMPIPIVCANMVLSETERRPSWMVPNLKLVRAGIRIGLIGVTAPFNEYYKLLGWDAGNPIDVLKDEVDRLRPEVDVLIVLSHLGIRQDERIASTIEGIDIILGGHTHHLLEVPLIIGNTAICAAGKFGYYIGHLELAFDQDNKLVKVTGRSLATDDYPRQPEMDNLVEGFRERARLSMNRVIADLAEPLDCRNDAESPLPTLLAIAVRRITGAEIGLVNSGQLLQGLSSGKVTEETIHAICPSPINPCLIKLSGALILRSLEESLLPDFQELEIRGFGFRGRVLGMLCLDGLEVMADLSQAPYHRVKEVRVHGDLLDESRIYSVGTLDMFTFGVGYVGLKEGRDVRYFLPEFIRNALSHALNEEHWIKESRFPRWSFDV